MSEDAQPVKPEAVSDPPSADGGWWPADLKGVITPAVEAAVRAIISDEMAGLVERAVRAEFRGMLQSLAESVQRKQREVESHPIAEASIVSAFHMIAVTEDVAELEEMDRSEAAFKSRLNVLVAIRTRREELTDAGPA